MIEFFWQKGLIHSLTTCFHYNITWTWHNIIALLNKPYTEGKHRKAFMGYWQCCFSYNTNSRTPTLKLSHIIIVYRVWRWRPAIVVVFAHSPTTNKLRTTNLQGRPLDLWISNLIKKIRVLSFWSGEEIWHQFMEEILGILTSM